MHTISPDLLRHAVKEPKPKRKPALKSAFDIPKKKSKKVYARKTPTKA